MPAFAACGANILSPTAPERIAPNITKNFFMLMGAWTL
jgi:hypothetical protein